MRKKVVKVALLSLVACGMPSAFVSCSDDDWKSPVENVEASVDGVNNTIKQLDAQIAALDGKIAENKTAADAAAKAAADAMAKAKDAATSAEEAKALIEKAQQELAKMASAEALAETAEQLKAEIEAVKALIEANKTAIANNKALIEGNAEAIKENAGKIEGNTEAIANLLKSLEDYEGETNETLSNLLSQLEAAGVSIADLQNTVAGINAAIDVIEGRCDALGIQIADLKAAVDAEIGDIEKNIATQIANEELARQEGDKALKEMIEELAGKIENLDLSTNLEQFSAFIAQTKTQLAALEAFKASMESDFAALSGKVDGVDAKVDANKTAIDNLTAELTALKNTATQSAATVAAQAALIEKNAQDISALQGDVAGVKADLETLKSGVITDLQEAVNILDTSITDINRQIDEISLRLNELEPLLNTMILSQLRGLVFIPNAYVGGIESALSYHVDYTALAKIAKTDAVYKGKTGYAISDYPTWNVKPVAYASEYYADTKVSYHMNPESAQVVFEDLSIVSTQAEVLTRSEASTTITLDKDFGVEMANGDLTVSIKGAAKAYDDRTGKEFTEDRQMPIFALQAKVAGKTEVDEDGKEVTKDNFVISDFAMYVLKNAELNAIKWYPKAYTTKFGAAAYTNRHDVDYISNSNYNDNTWTSGNAAGNAVSSNTTVTAPYDGSKQVVLSELLAVNYVDENDESKSWTLEEWEKYGLTMNFQLVPYTIGTNKVPESDWVTALDTKTGAITPKDDIESIGHMPLVYVTVSRENNLVLSGFVKILITPVTPYYMTDDIAYGNVNFNCDGGTFKMPTTVNLYAMIEKATETATAPGYNKTALLENYQPDAQGTVMRQYVMKDGDFVAAEGEEIIGVVNFERSTADVFSFTWVIDGVEDKQKLYDDNANHEGRAYIRFMAKGDQNVYPPIYIPLELTVNPKHVFDAIVAKVPQRWFRENTDKPSALLNVKEPTTGVFVTDINTNLNILWEGDVAQFTPAYKPNPATAGTAVAYKYYFTANNNGIKFSAPTADPTADNNTNLNAIKYGSNEYYFYVDYTTNPALLGGSASNANMGDLALVANNVDKSGAKMYDVTDNSEYNNTNLYVVSYDIKGNIKTKVKIATLNQDTGVISYVKDDNGDSYVFLNMFSNMGGADRTDAKLTPLVGVVPYLKECGIAFDLKAPDFFVTFLRPINVAFSDYTFTDAAINGDPQYIYNMIQFTDWRGESFTGNEWFFAYYGVTGIEPDLTRMYDTLNQSGEFKPSAASTIGAFEYKPAEDMPIVYAPEEVNKANNNHWKTYLRQAFGELAYNNIDASVKNFQVKIPFKVTYELGEFEVWVTCNINTTMGGK